MTAAVPNDLARALRAFFADHLPRVRGTSPHTIRSYRDSLVLLLRFVATQTQRSVIQLDLDDLGPRLVLAFLQHLELDRHNSVATRNVRLAAIHAFFRYCALEYPARLAHCQRVLAVPFKRTGSRLVEYLEHEEIEAILGVVDRGTVDGRRDYALLATIVQHRRAGPGNRRPGRRRPALGHARAGPPARQGAEGTGLPVVAPDRRPAACQPGPAVITEDRLVGLQLAPAFGQQGTIRRPLPAAEVVAAT